VDKIECHSPLRTWVQIQVWHKKQAGLQVLNNKPKLKCPTGVGVICH
jgi:hypothetical protein